MALAPVISIIDDDASVREAVQRFLRALGYVAHAFASADEFLRSPQVADNSCLIMDVKMPGMSGIELQRQLQIQGMPSSDHFHHLGRGRKHPHAGFECRGGLLPHQAVRDTDLNQTLRRSPEAASNRSHNGVSGLLRSESETRALAGCRRINRSSSELKPRYLFSQPTRYLTQPP